MKAIPAKQAKVHLFFVFLFFLTDNLDELKKKMDLHEICTAQKMLQTYV